MTERTTPAGSDNCYCPYYCPVHQLPARDERTTPEACGGTAADGRPCRLPAHHAPPCRSIFHSAPPKQAECETCNDTGFIPADHSEGAAGQRCRDCDVGLGAGTPGDGPHEAATYASSAQASVDTPKRAEEANANQAEPLVSDQGETLSKPKRAEPEGGYGIRLQEPKPEWAVAEDQTGRPWITCHGIAVCDLNAALRRCAEASCEPAPPEPESEGERRCPCGGKWQRQFDGKNEWTECIECGEHRPEPRPVAASPDHLDSGDQGRDDG